MLHECRSVACVNFFTMTLYYSHTDHVEGVARLTEARLRRDVTEGKIVDFRHIEGGFEVVRVEAITQTQNKVSNECGKM